MTGLNFGTPVTACSPMGGMECGWYGSGQDCLGFHIDITYMQWTLFKLWLRIRHDLVIWSIVTKGPPCCTKLVRIKICRTVMTKCEYVFTWQLHWLTKTTITISFTLAAADFINISRLSRNFYRFCLWGCWNTVGAPNDCGDAKRSQQCHTYILQYSTFASGSPQVRTRG